jgi:secretion/DNA translocation related TadE-like protein
MSADDRGSATVLALGICLAALLLVVTVAGLGSAVAARHRAESVADLASLAGADVALGRAGGVPCDAARRVVEGSGPPGDVVMVDCQDQGPEVPVRVAVRPTGWVGVLGPASAAARAGPAPRLGSGVLR